jgi:L-ascorbate metabolism protein UlaG (beta-lactamase superfamily)
MATRLTWYGHAALGLETGGYNLLVDPFFTGNPAAKTSPDSLEADFILVSHGHSDHTGDALAIARRTGAAIISNAEIVRWYQKQGMEKTHAQHIGGGHQHPFGYLKFTPAMHGSGLPDGVDGGNPCGFLLTTNDDERIYMAQDTGLFSDMRLIGDEGIDLAVLPIGDNYTMGPEDALRAVKFLGPRVVIPIHYNTWDLIKQDPESWARLVQEETDARVVVLKPGESHTI